MNVQALCCNCPEEFVGTLEPIWTESIGPTVTFVCPHCHSIVCTVQWRQIISMRDDVANERLMILEAVRKFNASKQPITVPTPVNARTLLERFGWFTTCIYLLSVLTLILSHHALLIIPLVALFIYTLTFMHVTDAVRRARSMQRKTINTK